MRVHELAKELDVPSKDILARLQELGVEAKSHMSKIEDAGVALIREAFGPSAAAEPVATEPAEAAPEAVASPEEARLSALQEQEQSLSGELAQAERDAVSAPSPTERDEAQARIGELKSELAAVEAQRRQLEVRSSFDERGGADSPATQAAVLSFFGPALVGTLVDFLA